MRIMAQEASRAPSRRCWHGCGEDDPKHIKILNPELYTPQTLNPKNPVNTKPNSDVGCLRKYSGILLAWGLKLM